MGLPMAVWTAKGRRERRPSLRDILLARFMETKNTELVSIGIMPAVAHHRRKSPRPAAHGVQQRIVAGARCYFFAHGFRGVTMDDLAAELGMSKKTLYVHFSSKMVLLQA